MFQSPSESGHGQDTPVIQAKEVCRRMCTHKFSFSSTIRRDPVGRCGDGGGLKKTTPSKINRLHAAPPSPSFPDPWGPYEPSHRFNSGLWYTLHGAAMVRSAPALLFQDDSVPSTYTHRHHIVYMYVCILDERGRSPCRRLRHCY